MKRAALLAVTLLSACATERQVAVQLPLSRMELPEAPARPLGAGISIGGAVRAVLTRDQTTTTPDPDAPMLEQNSAGQLRFDWQVAAPFELSARSWGGTVVGGQIKWFALQPDGGTGGSLALTGGYGGGKSRFDFDGGSDASHTRIRQTLLDAGAVLGWRWSRHWLTFGGPFYSRNRYRGHYFSARGSNPDIDTDFSGGATLAGANFGLAYTPLDWLSVAAEAVCARVRAGARSETPVSGTLALQFRFGARTRTAPAERESPVKVVPPVTGR